MWAATRPLQHRLDFLFIPGHDRLDAAVAAITDPTPNAYAMGFDHHGVAKPDALYQACDT